MPCGFTVVLYENIKRSSREAVNTEPPYSDAYSRYCHV